MSEVMDAVLLAGERSAAELAIEAIGGLNLRLAGLRGQDEATAGELARKAEAITGHRPRLLADLDAVLDTRPALVIAPSPQTISSADAIRLAENRTPLLAAPPLAGSAEAVSAVVAAFAASETPLGGLLPERMREELGLLRAYLAEADAGPLRDLHASLPAGSDASAGMAPALADVLDLVGLLAGPVTDLELTAPASAGGAARPLESGAQITMTLADGATGVVELLPEAAADADMPRLRLSHQRVVATLAPGRLRLEPAAGVDGAVIEETASDEGLVDRIRATIFDFAVAAWEGTPPMVPTDELLVLQKLLDAVQQHPGGSRPPGARTPAEEGA